MLSRIKISRTGQFFVYEVKQGINLQDFTGYSRNAKNSHFVDFAREEMSRCGVEVPKSADVLTWGDIPDAQAALFLWEGRGVIASKSNPDEWVNYLIGHPAVHKPRPAVKVELLPYSNLDSFYLNVLELSTRQLRFEVVWDGKIDQKGTLIPM